MKFLIPIILLLVGLGGGVGAGLALRPEPKISALTSDIGKESEAGDSNANTSENHSPDLRNAASVHDGVSAGNLEYIKLNNQFVVPIIAKESVNALIIMSLSLEMANGESEIVYAREPKLRDEFLRVLFDYANMGGFRGTFTDTVKLASLRDLLLQVAQNTLGRSVQAVLITDIARQDL